MSGFWYIRAVALALLHGLGMGPKAWQPQLDELGPERTVLAPRLQLDGGFTIEREAGRLLRELPQEPLDLCGLSLGALVAALPHGRFEIVPGAGHVANADAPEAFTAALRSFLDWADPQP
jgi:pimeloyl-ACP methyl ester carboxylesterase